MKRCRECNREYLDDSMRFCLDDGTPLSSESYRSEAAPTAILPPRVISNPSVPTIPSYSAGDSLRSEQQGARRTNPVLTAGVIAIALLLMALVAIAGYFVFKQSDSDTKQPEVSGKDNSPAPTDPGRNPTPDSSTETNWSGSPTGAPVKITASASSVRLAVQSNTYYPANAMDGKRSTAWIEGEEDGPGVGEWIRFDFDREINLHRILVQPGYFKSPQIWAENNRLATVTAQFSDGSSRELTFADRMDSQKIDIGKVRTKWVRFVIKSIYNGTDPDTAVSEIAFEWD